MKFLPSLFFLPVLLLALTFTSCSGDNSDDLTMDIDEVVPATDEAYIEYRGAKSALVTGYGYTCTSEGSDSVPAVTITLATNLEPGDDEIGTGDNFAVAGQFVAFEISFDSDVPFRAVALAVDVDDTVVLAQCDDCISRFDNDGTNLSGEFAGEFYTYDLDTGLRITIGDLSGDFNVPLQEDGFDCE